MNVAALAPFLLSVFMTLLFGALCVCLVISVLKTKTRIDHFHVEKEFST